jgi:hypothetical protein
VRPYKLTEPTRKSIQSRLSSFQNESPKAPDGKSFDYLSVVYSSYSNNSYLFIEEKLDWCGGSGYGDDVIGGCG